MSTLEIMDTEETETIELTKREEFRVDSEEKVNWLLRKLGNIEAERRRVKSQAEGILKRLEMEEESLRKRFGLDAEMFCRAMLETQKSKKKYIDFLQGRCQFRSVPASVKITNEKDALDYAKVTGLESAVKTLETLDKEAFKQYAQTELETNGVLIPGVEFQPEHESFAMKVNSKNEEE